MQIDSGNINVRYSKKEGVFEIEPSTIKWGKSHATISGTFRRIEGEKTWAFALKADDAALGAEEFGLAPIKVDEWSAEGTVSAESGTLNLSRFVLRSGSAALELAGKVIDAPGSPEIHLTGTVTPMPADMLKRFWPKFILGDARKWAMTSVKGGEVRGGRISVALKPGELARLQEQGLPPEALDADLEVDGLAITYVENLPPVILGPTKLKVSGITFTTEPSARLPLRNIVIIESALG